LYIKQLDIANFRNYDLAHLEPCTGTNLIIGKNAQGKTNLIEAICYLSAARSFRTSKEADLLQIGASQARVRASIFSDRDYLIDVKFKASPFRYPIVPKLPYAPSTFPDLDGDGAATSADAAIIMTAATAISAGNASGLTPEQEVLADADRDGVITSLDAAIVLEFATAASTGKYKNSPEGWAAFMNTRTSAEEGIL